MTKKFSIGMNEDLFNEIDLLAKKQGLSRSGLVTTACREYVEKQKAISMFADVKKAIEDIKESGNVSEDTLDLLNDFDNASKLAIKYSRM